MTRAKYTRSTIKVNGSPRTLTVPQLSVVVCTVGRESVYETLDSIYHNSVKPFEVILVSQNKKLAEKKLTQYPNLKQIYTKTKGLGVARNIGIKHSSGSIICFTDDDCIVDAKWLASIANSLQQHPSAIGVFGASLPHQPEKHAGKICPSIFSPTDTRIVTKPRSHAQDIGYGNNMAFLKKVFVKHGYFKEWLGAGSIGQSAEDAEFALRLLSRNETLITTPTAKVYHNRWLTPKQWNEQLYHYLRGELCVYSYFALAGYTFSYTVLKENLKDSFSGLVRCLSSAVQLKRTFFSEIKEYVSIEYSKFIGVCLGAYFCYNDPIRNA